MQHLSKKIALIECPRDAMQGWHSNIPTVTKIKYLNTLLQVGFDVLDCGSFVSAKAIPQMVDTAAVIKGLQLQNTNTKLLTIVANERGATEAVCFDEITYLGFPFSISPTFQLRNTNSTIEESTQRLDAIQELCVKNNKQLVVYLSMGFGNPYGDVYNEEILLQWANAMVEKDIQIIQLSDTVGMASPMQIATALNALIPAYTNATFGVHLHSTPNNFEEKLSAALHTGCTRIDGALKGIGGCPMAQDSLVGNMNTEMIVAYLQQHNYTIAINNNKLLNALQEAATVFV
jgi:hydroxymethylglutaryl-CoA lyase